MSWESMDARSRDVWIQANVIGTPMPADPVGWPPRYTTDASADYLVLKHVRENCGGRMQETMAAHLMHIGKSRCDWSSHMGYKPGDYSYAAYLAMREEVNHVE